ncbi:MAG: hypothetical protein JO030_08570 [Candidatus Eremiobacteraeota bacterium]|nr:hypothetical protein [Candidatus Eremiobacteraeota bacterium]
MRSRARVRYYLWGWSALAAVLVVALTASALTQHHPTAAPQSVHAQTIARDDARAIAVLDTQTGPRREHQAESLAVGPAIATRRVTVQLTIRAQGNPTRCIVTSSSGDRALDLALCRVATSRRIK